MLIGLLWILEETYSSFGCDTKAYLLSDPKTTSFAWYAEQERAMSQVQVLPLGPYDPADPMVLEAMSVADRDVWSL